MSPMIGSSPAELEGAARELDEAADWVRTSGGELSSSLGSLSWAGSAALMFTDAWSTRYKPAMVSTESFLRDQASRLREQARQQRDASGTGAGVGSGSAGSLSMAAAPSPPGGDHDSPARSHKWWSDLTEDQRRWVEANHPDWVRNRDGIPAAVRDRLNRLALETERARLQAEYDDYAARGRKFGGLFTNDDREAELIGQRLKAIAEIDAALGTDPDHYLLVFDASGDKVVAAVASGDIDNARHVAVMVPGMSTTVEGAVRSKTLDADRVRAYAEVHADGSVATVAWLGYDAPPDISDADDLNKARVGADALGSFLQGVRLNNADAHLTVLGHSYGSTVTGIALAHLPSGIVDDVVVYGSPGLADGSAGMAVDRGHAYVIEAKNDAVADVGTGDTWYRNDPRVLIERALVNGESMGGDPGSDPSLTRLSAEGSSGHSQYLRSGTTSLDNIAAVVGGNPENLVVERYAAT